VLASDLLDYRALAQDENLELAWFEPGNPADLAQALEALLDDRKRRQRVVRHNLDAMKRLGPTQTVEAYLAEFANGHARMSDTHGLPTRDPIQVLERGGER
jgi:hypothetical protein